MALNEPLRMEVLQPSRFQSCELIKRHVISGLQQLLSIVLIGLEDIRLVSFSQLVRLSKVMVVQRPDEALADGVEVLLRWLEVPHLCQ